MARIIVLPDIEIGEQTPILFDEQVSAVHVDNKHSAFQLIERLIWAIHDAEAIEHEQHPPEQRPANQTSGSRGERLVRAHHWLER